MEKIKNIVFISLIKIDHISERGIYTDLLREFYNRGYNLTIIYPYERRENKKTKFYSIDGINYLGVRCFNIQKTNFFEKGLATIFIANILLKAIKQNLKNLKFDLIIYTTPPITFYKVIKYLKSNNKAKTYLLLKDIFPQNAVDLGLLSKKGLIYNLFRRKEKKLYNISDKIGCMSPENINYLLKNNNYILPSKVEVNPNSIHPKAKFDKEFAKKLLRQKFNIDTSQTIFLYGGNLGISQGVEFLIEILLSNNTKTSNAFFVIIGSGVKYKIIENCINENNLQNVLLLPFMAKVDYDKLIEGCDVGLIFLNARFTYPNFPSRLLSYLENMMPVITSTDKYSDIGDIAEQNKFGIKIFSGDILNFNIALNKYIDDKQKLINDGMNGHIFLNKNYTSENSYNILISNFV